MLKPIGDRVVVEVIEVENKTTGGIILTSQTNEKPNQGKVIAVGKGKFINSELIPLEVKVNDTVLFSRYAGVETKFEGKDYLILKQEDILAVVE